MTALTRRDLLLGAAAAAGALAIRPDRAVSAPVLFDGKIRVLGLGYDLRPAIRKRAEQDLGLKIVSTAESPSVIHRLVSQQPASFDVFSCFQQDIAEFWATGNLQSVEIGRVERWQDITPLYTLGKAQPRNTRCAYGQGEAAFRRLYVDPDSTGRWRSAPGVPATVKRRLVEWVDESTGKPVGTEPKFCTGVPSTFNFDSFGYNTRVLGKRAELSWAELLNVRWRGRVGLNGFEPHVGLQDTANAVQAHGLMRFGDLGDPTRSEIDRLVKILLAYRKRGQFFDIWPQGGDPVEWMQDGKVVLCTMYTDQIESLATLHVPVHQAVPREGHRAFAGLLAVSSAVKDKARLDACYAFLNWWHSGFAGAVLLREGYYNAVQATSRRFMTAPGEYAYWTEGRSADNAYPDPYGNKSVEKGQIRDGGSFERRACRISSWNSTPRQEQYFLNRWKEFLSSF